MTISFGTNTSTGVLLLMTLLSFGLNVAKTHAAQDVIDAFETDYLSNNLPLGNNNNNNNNNEDFVQCTVDGFDFADDHPGVEQAEKAFINKIVISPIAITGESATMNMVFSPAEKEAYKSACLVAGGDFQEMEGSITCRMMLDGPDPDSNDMGTGTGTGMTNNDNGMGMGTTTMTMTMGFQNFGTCLPKTQACDAVEIWDVVEEMMEGNGFECDVDTALVSGGATILAPMTSGGCFATAVVAAAAAAAAAGLW